jgi:hypothetical protein
MRIVCYVVHIMKLKQGEDPQVEENIFFGPVDEMNKELRDLERLNGQAQITHALDGEVLAMLKNKEQVFKILLGHDLNKLPVFPLFGAGQGQCRFDCYPNVAFINNIRVSIRGKKADGEPVQKEVGILLPAGVRID